MKIHKRVFFITIFAVNTRRGMEINMNIEEAWALLKEYNKDEKNNQCDNTGLSSNLKVKIMRMRSKLDACIRIPGINL